MNDPRWARRYTQNDAPRLREIRKRLDSEPGTAEVDVMAYDLLEEVVPLASDYIGNTIVQKVRFSFFSLFLFID
jgi:protein JSN1